MMTAKKSLKLSKINQTKQLNKIFKSRYKTVIKILKNDIKAAIRCGDFSTTRYVDLEDLTTMVIEYFASKGYKVVYNDSNFPTYCKLTIRWKEDEVIECQKN